MQEQNDPSDLSDSDSSSSDSPIPDATPTTQDPSSTSQDPSLPTFEPRGHGFLSKVGTGVVRSIWKKKQAASSSSNSNWRPPSPVLTPTPERAPQASPFHIAYEIRELCGHDATTIFQRYKESSSSNRLSSHSNEKALKKMCVRLLECCRSTQNRTIKTEATKQIRALAVEDPIIRRHLRLCISRGKVRNIEDECIDAISDSNETFHALWSEFLGERVFEAHEESRMKDYYKALGRTLTNNTRQEVAILASKYLSYAVARKLGDREIGYFFTIWNHFIQHLVQHDPPSFDWWDMSKYIMTITRNESMDGFVSPAHLSAVAPYIMRPSARYPPMLRHFFSIPTLKFDRTNDRHAIFRAELVYSRKHDWSLYHAASYAVPFANALSGRKLDTRSAEGTVFLSEAWMSLYRVADYAIMNYRRGNGLTAGGIGLTASIRDDLLAVAERSIQFLNSNRTSINTYDMLHAAFNIVHSVGVDRYCKRAVHLAWALSDAPWRLDLYNSCSSFFQNDVRIQNGINDSAYIPHFQNAPYLRRFRIGGTYFITSDYLPECLLAMAKRHPENLRRELSIDTMWLDGKSLVCLHVNGNKFYLNVTGHYPILAGYDTSGEPLYVAAIRVGEVWYFTTVTNGAAEATYIDELGEVHTVREFFVLALRHDPSDLQQPYPCARKGAMDPTGPLYWLKLWPEQDPDYFEDIILKYDRPPESFESYWLEDPEYSDDERFTNDRILESFFLEFLAQNSMEHDVLSGFE